MADPAAEVPAPRPDTMFGVLVAVIVLAAIFGIGVAFVGLRVQGADSRELFEDLFAPGVELPMDLRFAGGTAVANKQRWVRLERSADGANGADGPEGAGDGEDTLPETVLIGRYAGPLPVSRQFETDRLPSGQRLAERRDRWIEKGEEGDEREDWTGLIDRGAVGFGPWEADYVHLREFQADGSFYDLIRVNLSTGSTGQILVGQWTPGDDGARVESLRPVLNALELSLVDSSSDSSAGSDSGA